MASINILAVSFAFPPLDYPRSIQVARILGNLEAEIVLFCAQEDKARHDSTIGQGSEERLGACVRVPFSPMPWMDFFRRRARFVGLPLLGQVPDIYRSWAREAIKAIEAFVLQKKYRPDILISFGQPWTDHLVGIALKRRYGWPWIAHFSDPWVANPYQQSDQLTKWINQRMERQVMTLADVLIFTNKETVELVMTPYPSAHQSKVHVVPHAFDPELYTAVSPNTNSRQKGVFRYLGKFYALRTPEPLFKALPLILEKKPELLDGICFELVGHCPPSMLQGTYRQLPKGLISLRPPVTYAESLNLMRTADALLLIDAPADRSVFLPSKLIEYVGAARPILGIVPPGASATLIRRMGGWVADPRYPEEIEAMLVNYISPSLFPNDWGEPSVRKEYEIGNVAKKINKIITDIIRKWKWD